MGALLFKSFPVSGVESDGDDLKVVGRCSDGRVDFDGDIVDPAWMGRAIKDYLGSYPAIRLQHRADSPVGRGLEGWQDPDGSTWLRALIVDPKAVKLVRKQVLSAFSVGIADPRQRRSEKCPRFLIDGGRLAEVSIVDSPANARCGITVTKGNQYVGRAWKGAREAEAVAARARAEALEACLLIADPWRREMAYGELAGHG